MVDNRQIKGGGLVVFGGGTGCSTRVCLPKRESKRGRERFRECLLVNCDGNERLNHPL